MVKTGFLYGISASILALVLMPFPAPLVFRGGNMRMIGEIWAPLSFALIGVPAFLVGCFMKR